MRKILLRIFRKKKAKETTMTSSQQQSTTPAQQTRLNLPRDPLATQTNQDTETPPPEFYSEPPPKYEPIDPLPLAEYSDSGSIVEWPPYESSWS